MGNLLFLAILIIALVSSTAAQVGAGTTTLNAVSLDNVLYADQFINTLSVLVTSGGSGYVSAPTVSISGGGCIGATGVAHLGGLSANLIVAYVTVTSQGTGCTSNPTVTLSGGSPAVAATAVGEIGDICAGANAAFSAAATSSSVKVELPPNTTINCTNAIGMATFSGGRAILEGNGATINFSGANDAIFGTGGGSSYINLEVSHLTIVHSGSGAGAGIHVQDMDGYYIHEVVTSNFLAGGGIWIENLNGFNEQGIIENCRSIFDYKGIRYTRTSSTYGTNSSFYNTLKNEHVDAGNPTWAGVSFEGNGTSDSLETYGSIYDIKYNINNTSSYPMSVVLASNGAMLQRNQFTLRGEATTQPSAPGNCLFKQADYISVIQVTDTYTYNGGANEICGMPVSNSNGHTVNGWQHANPEQTAQYYNSIRTSDTGSYGGSFEDALSGYVGHAASTQWTWKNNNSSSNAGSINNSAESDQPYNVADSQQNNVLYLDGTGNVGIGTGFNDTTVNGCNILSATRTTNNINTLTLNCTLSANLSGPFLVKGIGQDQFFNTPQGQTTSATVPGTCSSSLPNCAGSNQISYSSVYAPNVSLAQPSSGGVYAGNYGSGVSATGYAGQYCVLTNFNGVTGASAELFLSGTNSINTGSAIIVTAPGSGATAGPSTATAGNGTASCSGTASMFAVLGPTCNCLGEVVPVYFPGATADVSGTFRLGGWTSSGTFPGTKAYAGTVYTQFATFLTGSITPTAVAASSGCSDQNFAANGTVTSNFGTTNSTTPSIYDAELTIVPPSTLGSGTASPGKVTVTGDVSIHFCVAGSASSWTPPAGVYTVVAIH